MRRALLAALALAGGAAACQGEGEARSQWVVHVGTDAPVPGFGDRIRIDVLFADGSTCDECGRTFGLESGLPISFGVVPREGEQTFVRARLFRAEATDAFGEPLEPILDVLGRLPEGGEGIQDVRVLLGMDCFGAPANPESRTSCDPRSGERDTTVVFDTGGPEGLPATGTWRGGEVACNGDAPAGMICVAGGLFLLGSRTYVPFGYGFDPVPEQLVQLSPFFLDSDEMTVATYRTLVGLGVPPPAENSTDNPLCFYTTSPGPNESASVSCLTHVDAAAACAALGKRLPTEAEWEYAAGGRSLESRLPWANPDASNETLCLQAVLARGEALNNDQSRLCTTLFPDLPDGPAPGGSPDDVTASGLRNLAGNLSEWVADDFLAYDETRCWGPDLALRTDPICGAGGMEAAARGGSFETIPYNAHVFYRRGIPKTYRFPWLGLRCAQDAQ